MSDMGFGPGPDGKWVQQPVEKGEPSVSDVHVDKPIAAAAPPASTAPPALATAKGVARCGNCTHFDPAGHCLLFNNYPVNAGMVCGQWTGTPDTKFIPPAEVQAAAKAAMGSGMVAAGITEPLAKGEGLEAHNVQVMAAHFADGPKWDDDAWGGSHAAKWAARVLKKLETKAPEPKTTAEKAEVDFEIAGTIVKVDAAQHLVFGWASIVTIDDRPVTDTQGDQIEPATLEASAYEFVLTSRVGGEMHETGKGGAVTKIGQLVESVVFSTEKITAMVQSLTAQGINAVMTMPFVGWWIGFKITDAGTWDAIQQGRLRAFSVGGKGKRAAC